MIWVKPFFSSSSHVPFKFEEKLEIPMYDGQINVEVPEVLNNWLKQMDVYFGLYQIQELQHISFACLKMTRHALLWWESYLGVLMIGSKPMIMKWEDFNAVLKSQFYPIGYEEDKLMKW
jgi:hypothetical protein